MKKILIPTLLSFVFSGYVSASENVNAVLPSGKTIVMEKLEAWKFGDSLDVINDLVMQPSFNPFIKDRQGNTALDYASKNKVKSVEYYLKKKEFKNQYRNAEKKHYGDYFSGDLQAGLIKAVANGSLSAVKEFLVSHPDFDLNYEMGLGVTPLAATSFIQDVDLAGEMFTTLISAGADVNQPLHRQGGDTVGHVFCSDDNFLMLLLAISQGYDINLRNRDGADVYEYSYQSGSLHCGHHLENIMNAVNEQVL